MVRAYVYCGLWRAIDDTQVYKGQGWSLGHTSKYAQPFILRNHRLLSCQLKYLEVWCANHSTRHVQVSASTNGFGYKWLDELWSGPANQQFFTSYNVRIFLQPRAIYQCSFKCSPDDHQQSMNYYPESLYASIKVFWETKSGSISLLCNTHCLWTPLIRHGFISYRFILTVQRLKNLWKYIPLVSIHCTLSCLFFKLIRHKLHSFQWCKG